MNNLIDNILTEWAYRVGDGMPDPKNKIHLIQLQESMESMKLDNEVIDIVMTHLYEAKGHKYIKRTGSKGNYQYTYPSDGSGKTSSKEEPKKSGTSVGNRNDRQGRFERGWEKGAPGNDGSMLNEEGSNHVAESMFDDPNMTEEEALAILLNDLNGTQLAKGNSSDSIAGDLKVGDLPPNTPKEKRGIVSKALLAVRNGKRKADKARKFQKKLGWKNAEMMNFGGEQSDKDKQIEFLKDKKVVAFKNGKKVIIPSEQVEKLIQSAGKGNNPSDTSSIIYNEETGEATILFHSDKDSRTAQTGNSTQRDELTGEVTKKSLDRLVENKVITQEQADEILVRRQAYAQRIDDIENEFQTRATNVSTKAIEMLDSGEVDAQDVISNFKKTSGAKGNPEKYWNKRVVGQFGSDILNDKNKKGEPTAKAKNAKKWLEAGNPNGYNNPPTEEQMLRAYLKRNSEKVPTGEDKAILGRLNTGEDTPARQKSGTVIKGFNFTPDSAVEIEKIRTRALEMELQQKEELNEQTVVVDGKEVGLGDFMASENVWKFGHMGMLTQDEGTVYEFDDMFEINMSGHYLNKDVLTKCMGVNNKTNFQQRFYVGDLAAQEDKDGNITGAGKILYFMKDTKGEKRDPKNDMIFQEKKIRTKAGPEAKASTVYNNGGDLKDCIDKHGKS